MNSPTLWRIVIGIGFILAIALGLGILIFPESPMYIYSCGRQEEAKQTITKMLGVSKNHHKIAKELREMKGKLESGEGGQPILVEDLHRAYLGSPDSAMNCSTSFPTTYEGKLFFMSHG